MSYARRREFICFPLPPYLARAANFFVGAFNRIANRVQERLSKDCPREQDRAIALHQFQPQSKRILKPDPNAGKS